MHSANGASPDTVTDVYLDMDGVLCDLHKAVFALFGHPELAVTPTAYGFSHLLDRSESAIWATVAAAGWEFWEEMEPFPWTSELWAWANAVGRVHVCSRPLSCAWLDARDVGNCLRGKMSWLRHRFGRKFNDVIFTPNKYAVSRPGVILVDDDESYETEFARYGGHQIIFPRPYNRFRTYCHDPMDGVMRQFELLTDE